jgi:hypothetical protein
VVPRGPPFFGKTEVGIFDIARASLRELPFLLCLDGRLPPVVVVVVVLTIFRLPMLTGAETTKHFLAKDCKTRKLFWLNDF